MAAYLSHEICKGAFYDIYFPSIIYNWIDEIQKYASWNLLLAWLYM
jgi:hypothetical protein